MTDAIDFLVSGRVQGVGFRPFVYRLAHELNICGWVRNSVGRVEIHAEGTADSIDAFRLGLIRQAPAASLPEIEQELPTQIQGSSGFYILRSETEGTAAIHVPADLYLCQNCECEFADMANRRYRYPFINCTQCGPRYTIINAMPYDRENTSMASFTLCDPCHEEYISPADRRFHAEPNACKNCGPLLSYYENDTAVELDSEVALKHAVAALRHGRILAVKGVGGYHLMCDAANEVAVSRLRKHKHRPHKPLALMVPAGSEDALDRVRELVMLDERSSRDLCSQSRPIILLPKVPNAAVCEEIAPGLNDLGVMLPPSPMHALLMADFGSPVVATSGNISGEPVLTDDDDAFRRLAQVAECWLTHNRDIVRPADDTVRRYIAMQPRMIRLGRGSAPIERQLPRPLPKPVIAVGGHLKNTVALAWGDRIVISPHIGDLDAHRSQFIFERVIADLQAIYQVKAAAIIHDLHPQYASSRWATQQELPVITVQHHRAHASALAGEHGQYGTGLMFTWDGVGLGDDKTLWGGEVFLGTPGNWRRVASFRPFRLLGGDRVAREPWRCAAALHWELGRDYHGPLQEKLARAAWLNEVNVIPSSAAGRLFDAAAAMLDLVHETSFEGQGPMLLEAIAENVSTDESLPIHPEEELLRIDWAPLVDMLTNSHPSIARRAGYFHQILANTVCAIAAQLRNEIPFDYVGLTGGVFQNRFLTELIVNQFANHAIPCLLHHNIPANDGGLSYGQIIEYQASLNI